MGNLHRFENIWWGHFRSHRGLWSQMNKHLVMCLHVTVVSSLFLRGHFLQAICFTTLPPKENSSQKSTSFYVHRLKCKAYGEKYTTCTCIIENMAILLTFKKRSDVSLCLCVHVPWLDFNERWEVCDDSVCSNQGLEQVQSSWPLASEWLVKPMLNLQIPAQKLQFSICACLRSCDQVTHKKKKNIYIYIYKWWKNCLILFYFFM